MTKREFIKRAMQLRPTARQWRDLVDRAMQARLVDYENADDSFLDVWPLVGAMHEHFAKWAIEGSTYETVRRKCRKSARRYHAVM